MSIRFRPGGDRAVQSRGNGCSDLCECGGTPSGDRCRCVVGHPIFALNWHGPCDSAEPTSRPGPGTMPITWCPAESDPCLGRDWRRSDDPSEQLREQGAAVVPGAATRHQARCRVSAAAVDQANALIEACPRPSHRFAALPDPLHQRRHTTEVMTAHAVTDLVSCLAEAKPQVFAAQVQLAGEWLDWHDVLGVPVLLGGTAGVRSAHCPWRRTKQRPAHGGQGDSRRLKIAEA